MSFEWSFGRYPPRRETQFRSSHFDQPNILAHVRFNERTDADGKRVLFIEELQSDWAQKGRKEGFVQSRRTHGIRNICALVHKTTMEAREGRYVELPIGRRSDALGAREA